MAESSVIQMDTKTMARPGGTVAGAGQALHLVAQGLARRFGVDSTGDWAVRDSNFEVARGEFFGLLGPSGSRASS